MQIHTVHTLLKPYLIDDVQGALEEVAHLPIGLALAGHVLGLLHQIRHHLLPVVTRQQKIYFKTFN